jgi:hypothetical protein
MRRRGRVACEVDRAEIVHRPRDDIGVAPPRVAVVGRAEGADQPGDESPPARILNHVAQPRREP